MKKFEQPIVETIKYEFIDIITISLADRDDDGYNNQVVKP